MWSAILGLAGTMASGVMSAINNRRAQQEADAESARQEAYYNARAAENPLSRSDNQALLGQYDREAKRQIDAARGVAAIKGATPEYAAAVQKGVAEGRANLMSNMAAQQSARSDRAMDMAERSRQQKALNDAQRRAARNETYAALASNAVTAFGSLADARAGGAQKPAAAAPEQAPEQRDISPQLDVVTDRGASKADRMAAAAAMSKSPVEQYYLAGPAQTSNQQKQAAPVQASNQQKQAAGTAAQQGDWLGMEEEERRRRLQGLVL